MARNTSPFAALTSEEKQIKWMEYQTIRLPYTQVSSPEWPRQSAEQPAEAPSATGCEQTLPQPQQPSKPVPSQSQSRPLPPPEVMYQPKKAPASPMPGNATPSPYQQMNAYQKTRHRQYDTVIERMKQAEKKTGCFQEWAK